VQETPFPDKFIYKGIDMKSVILGVLLLASIGTVFADSYSDAAEAREEARRAYSEAAKAREEIRQYRQLDEQRRAQDAQRTQDKAVFDFMKQTRDKSNNSWPE
jgi:hypothetical protein